MTNQNTFFTCLVLLLINAVSALQAGPKVEIPLTPDFNIFEADTRVEFSATVSGVKDERTLCIAVIDYYGNEVFNQSYQLSALQSGEGNLQFEIGTLPKGYYEVLAGFDGREASRCTSFGVMHFLDRSAKEAREGGYRFGLKLGGTPRGFDKFGAMNVAARLGLQWTRYTFSFDDIDQLHQLPVNIIYKVEGIPFDAYDEERYGPRDTFRLRHFGWNKASVPLEEPFKRWIQDLVRSFPAEQNVFEVWNEPWGKYAPHDFARVAQWSKEAILELRPDAIIGPNLGHLNYDAPFLEANGMNGMNALFLHPYAPPERSEKRKKIRQISDFYSENYEKPIELYVTEFGAATPPAGPFGSASENGQVRRVLRDAFVFLAEDVKAFTPHWLGQNERSVTNAEDWYGFFRADGSPKPVLVAFANQAQVLDGGEYIGHLFYQTDVGAMLMKNNEEFILSLWTNDLDFSVEVETGVESVTLIDTVGRTSILATPGGKVTLQLNGDPIYLLGVSPQLVEAAQKEPFKGQWEEGVFQRNSRDVRKMKNPPVIDAENIKEEFAGQTQIPLSVKGVDADNISAVGYVAWDDDYLYVAAEVRDDDPYYNPNKRLSIYDADSLEVWFCSDVKYQVPMFFHTHDVHMMFSPTSNTGGAQSGIVNHESKRLDPIHGLIMNTKRTSVGWNIEMAIPKSACYEFEPVNGLIGAFEMRVNDGDRSRPNGRDGRFKANPTDGGFPSHLDATLWSYLKFIE